MYLPAGVKEYAGRDSWHVGDAVLSLPYWLAGSIFRAIKSFPT
jgi:hypothetical protein